MLSKDSTQKSKPLLFIPQRLNLGFWVLSLLYTALIGFVPLFAIYYLFKDAWQAGRLQSSGLPDILALVVILGLLLAICWPFAHYFFRKWNMARMDEFWLRRDEQYSYGIALGMQGVSVRLFDNQFHISRDDFSHFALYFKRSRHSELPYLQLHYLDQGKSSIKELYWDELLWHKAAELSLESSSLTRQQKQDIVEYLNQQVS